MELPCKDDGDMYFNELLLQHIEQRNNAEVLAILKDVHLCQITDNSGDTLLHFAARYGNVELARYLIDLGANIDAQNHSKETPLMFAVQNQETETVKFLLEHNAEIFVLDLNGKCALRKAIDISRFLSNTIFIKGNARKADVQKLEISKSIVKIFEELVTIESFNNSRQVDNKNFHVEYPLYLYILMKNAEITRVLLENDSPVNAKEPDTGDTPLHIAVRAMDLQKIELLLKFNADVNMKNHEGKTPLACLSFFRNRDKMLAILNALMAAGADLIDRDRGVILVKILLQEDKKEVIRDVLKHKIDLHCMDKAGYSALHYLADNANPDVLVELRGFDFNVNVRTRDSKMTMLHLAAHQGNASSVKFLLDREADVDATCPEGNTALGHIFVRSHYIHGRLDGYRRCVEILLASGADPRIVTEEYYRKHWHWLNQQFSNEFIRLMGPVLIHLSAVEASGREIGKIIRTTVQSSPQLKEIFDSKKVQLEEMKAIQLEKSVTLLDFIVASKKVISVYARNRRIILGSLNTVKDDSLEPCYRPRLCGNLLRFTRLIKLRKKCTCVVYDIIDELYNTAVYDIAEKIVDYLEDHELCKLLETIS